MEHLGRQGISWSMAGVLFTVLMAVAAGIWRGGGLEAEIAQLREDESRQQKVLQIMQGKAAELGERTSANTAKIEDLQHHE